MDVGNNDEVVTAAAPEPSSNINHGVDDVMKPNDDVASTDVVDSGWAPARYVRVAYFSYFAALSSFQPFVPVVLGSRGVSPGTTGVLMVMFPLAQIVVAPFVSLLCDMYQCTHTVIVVCTVFSTISGAATLAINSKAVTMVAVCFTAIFGVNVGPLYDRTTLAWLGDTKQLWGTFRLFGAYGWGLFAPLAALPVAISRASQDSPALPAESPGEMMTTVPIRGSTADLSGGGSWTYMAIPYVVFMAVFVVTAHRGPNPKIPPADNALLRTAVRRVVRDVDMLLFFAAVTLMGTGFAIITTYLFLFLDELGASPVLLGITLTVTVTVEIPLFQRAAYFLERFTVHTLLLIAMAAWVVRVFGYSLLWNPYVVLLLEPLHGMTFGCTWLAATYHVSNAFPAQLSNSATNILYASFMGVGPIIGTFVGGFVYERYGPRNLFRGSAVAMLVAFVCYAAYVRLGRPVAGCPAESCTTGQEVPSSKAGQHPDDTTSTVDVVGWGDFGETGHMQVEDLRKLSCEDDDDDDDGGGGDDALCV